MNSWQRDYTFAHVEKTSLESARYFHPIRKIEVDEVACGSDAVRFKLVKPKGNDYSIANYLEPKNENAYWLDFRFWDLLSAPFSIHGYPMSSMMHRPSFAIRSVSSVSRDQRPCIRIEFSVDVKDLPKGVSPIESGWLIVSPRDQWAIQEASLKWKDQPEDYEHVTIEYPGEKAFAVPIPARLTREIHPKSRNDSKFVFELKSIEFKKPNREIFTLAHYGLPQPGAIAVRSWSPTPLLFIGLGLIALVVAVALKYISARAKRSAPT